VIIYIIDIFSKKKEKNQPMTYSKKINKENVYLGIVVLIIHKLRIDRC
jgi:hypothetical protein